MSLTLMLTYPFMQRALIAGTLVSPVSYTHLTLPTN